MSVTVTVRGRQRGTFCKTSFFQTSSSADPGLLRVPQCSWVTLPDVSKKQNAFIQKDNGIKMYTFYATQKLLRPCPLRYKVLLFMALAASVITPLLGLQTVLVTNNNPTEW